PSTSAPPIDRLVGKHTHRDDARSTTAICPDGSPPDCVRRRTRLVSLGPGRENGSCSGPKFGLSCPSVVLGQRAAVVHECVFHRRAVAQSGSKVRRLSALTRSIPIPARA